MLGSLGQSQCGITGHPGSPLPGRRPAKSESESGLLCCCLRGEPVCDTLRLHFSQRRADSLSLRFNDGLLFQVQSASTSSPPQGVALSRALSSHDPVTSSGSLGSGGTTPGRGSSAGTTPISGVTGENALGRGSKVGTPATDVKRCWGISMGLPICSAWAATP